MWLLCFGNRIYEILKETPENFITFRVCFQHFYYPKASEISMKCCRRERKRVSAGCLLVSFYSLLDDVTDWLSVTTVISDWNLSFWDIFEVIISCNLFFVMCGDSGFLCLHFGRVSIVNLLDQKQLATLYNL